MKNRFIPPARYALLTACLLSGFAQAQSIDFTGDTNPTGSLGASHTATQVIVGDSATGALSIQNGGQLTSQTGSISEQNTGRGSVVVEDTGSSWLLTSATGAGLVIGNRAAASLRVRNGGTVLTNATLGSTQSTVFTVEVDGANSSLRGANCDFDGSDVSTLQINNGALMHCEGSLIFRNGALSLSGAGSKLLAGDEINLKRPLPGYASLTVGEGATVETGKILRVSTYLDGDPTGPTMLTIEGTTTPGAVIVPTIGFEEPTTAALMLNHSDASGNYRIASDITGYGRVFVNNFGTTTLSGNNSYENETVINAGLLRAGAANSLSPASDFTVAADGTLDTNTFSGTVKSLNNSNLVTMAAGGTSNVLTVSQNYTSNGGVVAMNTALGADSSPTQKLVVQGDTSGDTMLNISNLGGTGAATTGNGIMVVQVDGASNGTFSLPAPGHVEAGGYRYTLAKVGNHWYLQSDAHVEASGPEASVVCTPAELSDTANQVATCTVTLTAAPTADLPINLVLPAANPRFTTTCASPLVVAANATQASCTITATPNTTAGDGDVSLELAIAPPTTADAYTPAGPAAQVLIKDAGDTTTQPPATLKQVPTLGSLGLAALAALMGAVGLRRSRKTV
ncbi:IPTL-CTERM sorting domain-containing protein [Comamonas sp. MYb69]|uniref:IPTL-CTERM sorting domain-containing protein n=1 Tax=Comamonas sp. MYb69 TaxID=1848650 RepID=UPI00309D00C2